MEKQKEEDRESLTDIGHKERQTDTDRKIKRQTDRQTDRKRWRRIAKRKRDHVPV